MASTLLKKVVRQLRQSFFGDRLLAFHLLRERRMRSDGYDRARASYALPYARAAGGSASWVCHKGGAQRSPAGCGSGTAVIRGRTGRIGQRRTGPPLKRGFPRNVRPAVAAAQHCGPFTFPAACQLRLFLLIIGQRRRRRQREWRASVCSTRAEHVA